MSEPIERPAVGTRDLDATRSALEGWLAERLPSPSISALSIPPTSGMSSETILFEATWGGEAHGLVGRIAPDPANAPVFPVYDISAQFRVMQEVRASTAVPVPEPLWHESDRSVLGQQFMIMRRVEGVVPPDVMPYTFGGNWLADAAPEDHQRLARNTIRTIAELHAIPDAAQRFGWLHEGVEGDTPLRRHVRKELYDYYDWAATETRSPLVERCFEWIEDHWPQEEGEAVLSWGDARIGNVLYRDFAPAAVLDWEMASVGPREIDLAWLQYLHRFFQDLAEKYGMPGLPALFRRADVVATYEEASGHRARDMDWYGMLAAARHGVVSLRTSLRQIQFGQQPMPDDVDDLIMHRATLEEMLAGTYWDRVEPA